MVNDLRFPQQPVAFSEISGRWNYGTTRVSGLALELENAQWMYLNGVILVSPTELGIDRDGPVVAANRLPYFAAAAWYHKALPSTLQNKDLTDMLPEVESFSINELLPALVMEDSWIGKRRKPSPQNVDVFRIKWRLYPENNLDVSMNAFWKELLRDRGFTIGRLDSRYLGIDASDAGDRSDYNAEITSWLHSFTPAINYYIREELGFKTDTKYNMFGPVHPWDRGGDQTGMNLRQAMAQNPYLNVMVQSGYYDGACTYFLMPNTACGIWTQAVKWRTGFVWKGYRSGHMMYLRQEDLKQANEDIRQFIQNTLPAKAKLLSTRINYWVTSQWWIPSNVWPGQTRKSV